MQILLRALDPDMIEALREAFQDVTAIDVRGGNILESVADGIVSPSNSFGYMDGGIDLAYRGFFGPELEQRLQQLIRVDYHGELPVGQAAVIETGHSAIPFLISAPTMRIPGIIDDTVNVYLAFRAALLTVHRFNASTARPIRTVLSPAFGTGVGGMDFRRAARQMRAAYQAVTISERPWLRDARSVLQHHHDLLR